MIKRFLVITSALSLLLSSILFPDLTFAAGVSASGGGSYNVGSSFTVNIVASGVTFNTFVGDIAISGPVTSSIAKGSYSSDPSDTLGSGGKHFDGGITSATTSFTIARVTLKGTGVGSGTVTVKNASLINNGVVTATGGGTTSFTINRAPTPSGAVTVTSSTNPDQEQSYGVATVQLAWTAPANGATGYSTVFDQSKGTTPGTTVTTTALTASFSDLNLGTYYFHIRAQNGDGWGSTTTFQVNISRSVDNALKAPLITGVTKTGSFKNDIATGTVTGFQISGSSTGLEGYTAMLIFVPAAGMPAAQKLDAIIGSDGNWSVLFDQLIPAGFYKVSVQATKDKTTTAAGEPITVELSVANGGTAKIITDKDLPQPDLTVKVAGIAFSDLAHFHKAELLVAGLAAGSATLAVLIAWLVMVLVKRYKNKLGSKPSKQDKARDEELKTPKPRML